MGAHGVTAGILGAVEGTVGGLDQVIHVMDAGAGVGGDAQADGDVLADLGVAQGGGGDAGAQALGGLEGGGLGGGGQDDDELLTAVAGREVGIPDLSYLELRTYNFLPV